MLSFMIGARIMGRLLLILVGIFMSLSLTGGSVAHSREPVTCVATDSSDDTWHSAGDSDQLPSDSTKDYAHHHGGCQGHQVGDAAKDFEMNGAAICAAPVIGRRAAFRADSHADPALRPPIA